MIAIIQVTTYLLSDLPILITMDTNVYSNDDYQISTATGMNAGSNIGFQYPLLFQSYRNGMMLLSGQVSDAPTDILCQKHQAWTQC